MGLVGSSRTDLLVATFLYALKGGSYVHACADVYIVRTTYIVRTIGDENGGNNELIQTLERVHARNQISNDCL